MEPQKQARQLDNWITENYYLSRIMLTQARLKKLLSYQQKKGRRQSHLFLVEGTRLTQEALNSDWRVLELYYSRELNNSENGTKLLKLGREKKVSALEVQEKSIRKMAETETPQGVVAVVEKKRFDLDQFLQQTPEFIIAIENLKDPGNLGTIIRTADALGGDGIFLSSDSVELYNPKVVRGTMGSLFHLPIFYPVQLKEFLSGLKPKFQILASVPSGGANCSELDYSEPVCLLLGGEAFGLSDQILDLADEKVSIPQLGSAESLNVSVAAGILMYEIVKYKKLRTKGQILRKIPKEC